MSALRIGRESARCARCGRSVAAFRLRADGACCSGPPVRPMTEERRAALRERFERIQRERAQEGAT